MKLVLTSGGVTNKSIENELRNLIGKDFDGLKLLFCTTASNYEGGEMNEWLIVSLNRLKELGFRIDICDINGVDKDKFLPRFENADVLYFEGGNTPWLRTCIKNSGLEVHLPELLKTKVWIGSSAGSCVLSPTLDNAFSDLFEDKIPEMPADGLAYVDFQLVPHFNNEYFTKINEDNIRMTSKNLKEVDGKKVYALDDNSALFVNNGDVKIISEGQWFEVDISLERGI